MKATIEAIQEQLKVQNIDGWLLHIWRDVNPVATAMLELPEGQVRSRRCYYWIPAKGSPRKLLHKIETATLDGLTGETSYYLSYASLQESLRNLVSGSKKIAMEYSPNCLIPTVSWVDAGTIELIRSFDVEVVSSADLIQYFEATLSDSQIETHFEAAKLCRETAHAAFERVGQLIRAGKTPREAEIADFIMKWFDESGLETDHGPIVAVNEHAADPHYEPVHGSDSEIKAGQLLLIDLWAKLENPVDSIYADQTWMAFVGEGEIPAEMQKVWEVVRDARDAGYELVKARYAAGEAVYGWEVDDAVREVIEKAGYGDYFIHRTGHSMTTIDHGSGANIDNLETKELRELIPRTLFSIEPGVYLKDNFGVRSEYDVLIDPEGKVVLADQTAQKDLYIIKI